MVVEAAVAAVCGDGCDTDVTHPPLHFLPTVRNPPPVPQTAAISPSISAVVCGWVSLLGRGDAWFRRKRLINGRSDGDGDDAGGGDFDGTIPPELLEGA